MELQLGLALPSNIVFGFDLNSYVYKPKEVSGSGQVNQHHHQAIFSNFSKASSTTSDECSSSSNNNDQNNNRKRSASVAFNEITRDDLPQTLPLLLWNNHPNDHEDDDVNEHNFSFASNKIEEDSDDDGIVGWPPIKYRRKKIRRVENNRTVDNGCADCRGKPSNYVKVKMDGVAIARKIDLSLHNSLQSLKETLLAMFGICEENSTSYNLTYQDREGDWLLAHDVSWRSFIGSVQRLKLMKNNNNGLYN